MRKVKIFAVCVLIILSFSVNAYAAGESEYYNGQVEFSGAEDILSGLDSETKERLGELGIEDVNFSSLFDVSFSKIFSFVKKAAEAMGGDVRAEKSEFGGLSIILELRCYDEQNTYNRR